MGVVQTEQVVATGEAYDVLLDMSFPKGRYLRSPGTAPPISKESELKTIVKFRVLLFNNSSRLLFILLIQTIASS